MLMVTWANIEAETETDAGKRQTKTGFVAQNNARINLVAAWMQFNQSTEWAIVRD